MKKITYIALFLVLVLSIQHAHAATYPDGCTATTAYSSTTGIPCTVQTCAPGDLFNSQTGQPCGNYLPGCNATSLYSVTTGRKCDGSMPVQQYTLITQAPTVSQQSVQAPVAPVPQAPATIITNPIIPMDYTDHTVSIRKQINHDNAGAELDSYVVEDADATGTKTVVYIVSSLDGATQLANQYRTKHGIVADVVIN